MTGLGERARSWAITPALVSFVVSSAVRARAVPLYRTLQRIDPVHESPIGIWVLTRHADVAAALRHPRMSVVEDNADESALRLGFITLLGKVLGRESGSIGGRSPYFEVFERVMLFKDPPDHTRLRTLVSKAFTPRAVEAIEPRVHEVVAELLAAVSARGRMDLMTELAYPLPARIICELLGVPASDQHVIVDAAPALATGLDPKPMRTPAVVDAANRAIERLTAYLDGLIGERRRHPGDDLLTRLVEAEDDGDRLTHDELVAMIVLLLIAGHETTANLLGNGMLALLRDQGALARLRRDPALDRTAVEELLRAEGPIQMSQRVTLDDVEIGGRAIPAGRLLVLCVAAANRDPEVFEDPGTLRFDRAPNPHLAFGGGIHFCAGAPLARLEARVALRALVDQLPGLRLAGGRPRFRPSFTIRGLTRLDVAWRAPARAIAPQTGGGR
jgi:cytochrome P450